MMLKLAGYLVSTTVYSAYRLTVCGCGLVALLSSPLGGGADRWVRWVEYDVETNGLPLLCMPRPAKSDTLAPPWNDTFWIVVVELPSCCRWPVSSAMPAS